MAGNIFVLPKSFPPVAGGGAGPVRAVCAAVPGQALCPDAAGNEKCGSSRELPQRTSAARGRIPPVVAAVMDRHGLVVPVARFRAGSHMGRGRGLVGLDPVMRRRRLPVVARRRRVVIPGVIIMHTACAQDEEAGEQDQSQDMQEPDKSGMCSHRRSLVASTLASLPQERKGYRA